MKKSSVEDAMLHRHSILLVGPYSAQCLVRLNESLSSHGEPSCWTVDLAAGLLCGDIVLDGRSARVEVAALAGREPYEAMHDATYAACDAVLCVMKDGFKKDVADRVYEHMELVKDGRRFCMRLVMVGVDPSSTSFLKAEEWAGSHEHSCAVAVSDEKAMTDILCRVATQIHRSKPLAKAHQVQGASLASCMGVKWKQASSKARPVTSECCIM